MTSKAGIFIHNWPKSGGSKVVGEWMAAFRPEIVKTMKPEIEEVMGYAGYRPRVVIGRQFLGNQDLDNPVGMAHEIADSALGQLCQRHVIDAMELHNEPNPHEGGWQRLLDFEPKLVYEMLNLGIPPIILNWSVGQPDEVVGQSPNKRMVFWDHHKARELMTIPGIYAYGEHDYCAPTMWQKESFDPGYANKEDYLTGGWYFGRYRRAYRQLRESLGESASLPPVFLGEIGIDGGIQTGGKWEVSATGGFKNFCTFAQYLEQLAWADRQMQMDNGQVVDGKRRPDVIGGTPFILTTQDMTHWGSFEHWGFRIPFGEYLRSQATNMTVEQWLSQWVYTPTAHIPFVPNNWIMRQILRKGYIPVSDEKPLDIPGIGTIFVQVAEAWDSGEWVKKVFYWGPGDWANYKVMTLPN